jgi:hypothetical protein
VRAEIVARGVHDGVLALGPTGTPHVAYVRGTSVLVSTRVSKGRWRAAKAGSVSSGSTVMAFRVGARGPVALVQSADDRTLDLIRARGGGWQRIKLAGRLPARMALGWPGLLLDAGGLPIVASARLDTDTLDSQLILSRVDARGGVRSQRVTAEGFPQSYVPPPATPVLVRGRVHVIEAYGYHGVTGTIEWYPDGNTWTGVFLDVGYGDFPLGPLLGRTGPTGTVYAAWTQSMTGYGGVAVTLATHGRSTASKFVLNRALTTALALPATGPEVAANQWVAADELGLAGEAQVWAGTVVRGTSRVQLDGWIAGLATAPSDGRDLLLGLPSGLCWFRSPRPLATRVTIDARTQGDGGVRVSGRVSGGSGGKVTLYRERPGTARTAVGQAALSGGGFSFVDRPRARPLLYRAVYTDPVTGIPYAALLRNPVS